MADTAKAATGGGDAHGAGETRRDFLMLATGAVGAIGIGAVIWPLIDSMNPAADVLALASVEVDLSPVQLGQRITVKWRGKPVFIDHRTPQQIEESKKVPMSDLKDPATDAERAKKPEWLIMIGICTHLGCIPLGQKEGDPRGNYGGWFCPCHGSMYDTAGRIRQGPAPKNLVLPDYTYLDNNRVKIG